MLSIVIKYFYPLFSFNKLLLIDLTFASFLLFLRQFNILFIYVLVCAISITLELLLFEIKKIKYGFLTEDNLNQNDEIFILDPKLKYNL